MKPNTVKRWLAIGASVLTTTVTIPAAADTPPTQTTSTMPKPDKDYTGTVIAVDPKEHVLSVKGWVFSKKSFNLGEKCAYTLLEKSTAEAADLHPGQRVVVNYQDVHGVLIADSVTQEPMRMEGMVKSIDADKHQLVLGRSGSDKHLQIIDDCRIALRNNKTGALSDIKVGDHVTVTYEAPGDQLVARQIAQTSIVFTGMLTAIDLDEKTVKARTTFESKKFNLADNCTIVINGQTDGRLADLKPNERLQFSYDEINGVNVVNRIAPVEGTTNSVAASESPAAMY
jgi:predicted RNA-binding protein